MAKEFIITEGDIDAALDLLLEYDPVDRYRKLMRFYKGENIGAAEKANIAKRLQSLKAKKHPELAKYKFPEPPKSKVPATTGTRAATKAGQKKAKISQTLTPAQQEIIAQAEVTPEKEKSGGYDVVTVGGKEYDKKALKVALINADKKTETLPPDERKTQQYNVAIIKKNIETPPENDKPVKTEIEIHKWSEPQPDGSVDWLAGFKFKGELGKSFGPLKAKFIEMFTFNRLGNALIKGGNSLALEGKGHDKESFFESFILPKGEQLEALVGGLNLMTDAKDGDSDEAKKAFEELASKLEEKKKILDTDSDLAKKFNAIKDEYLEKMFKEVEKMEEDSSETQTLQEGMLHSITIDFAEIRRKQKHLDESFLVMFGGWVKWLLEKMFGGGSIPGTIKGSKREVESFARAMGSEKRYIETAKRYGLDHPTTYKSKAKLSSATKGFEKETGIKWPFE